MKKFIVALAAVAITAGFANAQDKKEGNCQGQNACTEQQCAPRQCDGPRDCARVCPFDGLNLTDAQKAQIKQICEKNRCDKQAKCDKQARKECKKAEKQAKKEACKQARKDFLAEIKGVLTPEQYIQFLENNFVNAKGDFKAGNARRPGKGDRCERGGDRGPRGPRGDRQQAPQK